MPERDDMEDRFADALDALALGMPIRTPEPDLAGFAEAIQRVGRVEGGEPMTDARLDRAAKSSMWADLMRERGGRAPTRMT